MVTSKPHLMLGRIGQSSRAEKVIKEDRPGDAPQKLEVKSNFWGVFYMAKYSEEFKMNVVTEYSAGLLGYPRLAKKYGMSSHGQIAVVEAFTY